MPDAVPVVNFESQVLAYKVFEAAYDFATLEICRPFLRASSSRYGLDFRLLTMMGLPKRIAECGVCLVNRCP